MTALLLANPQGVDALPLTRRSLRHAQVEAASGETMPALPSGHAYNESWLQGLLFRHPELLLLERMEAGAGDVVPLCRELSIPRAGGSVFLDMLGVTQTGRLVLVECKLWRNPQARREVVAQIVEYAALLRHLSFGDLTTRLKQKLGVSAANPIYRIARKRWPDLDEADFVDGVSRSLALGDFHLIVAGDGIRSDLQTVAAHLNALGAGLSRLSLLEIQLWADSQGRTLVVPTVPLRTEIIEQRVFITQSGAPLQMEVQTIAEATSSMESVVDPNQSRAPR